MSVIALRAAELHAVVNHVARPLRFGFNKVGKTLNQSALGLIIYRRSGIERYSSSPAKLSMTGSPENRFRQSMYSRSLAATLRRSLSVGILLVSQLVEYDVHALAHLSGCVPLAYKDILPQLIPIYRNFFLNTQLAYPLRRDGAETVVHARDRTRHGCCGIGCRHRG